MKAGSKSLALVSLFALATLAIAAPALAQEKAADKMQILREKLRADKKLMVSEVMGLTETEAQGFWSVYESYQNDQVKVNDRVIKLVKDYASSYGTMTNDAAKKLVDDSMAIEADRLKVRQSYLAKFRKVLPETKVARFYQVENKLQAIVNYDLASEIPLTQ